MDFREFKTVFQSNFANLTKNQQRMFEVAVDKDEMWNLYLDSFPPGTNEVFRERREHDCSCCRHFIKSIGNVVVIENNKVKTIWDFQTGDTTYQPVIDALNQYVLAHTVANLYLSDSSCVGTDKNYEHTSDGKVFTWEHFYLDVPAQFVNKDSRARTYAVSQYRDTRNVFERSLKEISKEAILTVLELINSNTLYKGSEWKGALTSFLNYQEEYNSLPDSDKSNYVWSVAGEAGMSVGRIKNHSIGVLLMDISNGVDLETAVTRYEKITAPENYKRPKAIFTKKMLEEAQKTVVDLGYMDSLARRYATLDDISINNILFANRNAAGRIKKSGDVFAEMMGEVKSAPKKFDRVEEISAEKFFSDVLPATDEVEVYLENKHAANMVSLIAPKNPDSKSMFKWNNGFSWAYSGNLTDSSMKENVKTAGGKVDGDLRFSIQWNDTGEYSPNDVDAHCGTPNGEIYFSHKRACNGELDVDIVNPQRGKAAVENITWANRALMPPGDYHFFVNMFSNCGGKDGFRAEVEFDGKIYSYDYDKNIPSNRDVDVATVTLDRNGNFSIKEYLPSATASKEIWGVKTNEFVPVTVAMYSPNYWDEQQGIGHKHYFFMLKDCVNPETPNGFYNEFLKPEIEKHRKVFEALGSKMAVETVEDQLSGIGFSSTKRAELVVKVKGQTERVMKIKF